MKTYNAPKFESFCDMVNYIAEKFKNRKAFQIKLKNGEYREITFSEFREHFYKMCSYLIKNGYKGAKIAISGKNCYEWVLSYICAATVGVAVPIDKELAGTDIKDFFMLAECKVIFCDLKVSEKISANLNRVSFDELSEIVDNDISAERKETDMIVKSKDEMSVLLFTSGTTGSSKGVMLSQNNILSNIYQTVSVVKIFDNDKTMSVLPLHHTYECTLNCLLILSRGACICYTESLQTIARSIREYSPSVLVVVPELLAILSRRIKSSVIDGCPQKYKQYFEENGLAYGLKKLPFFMRNIIQSKVRKTLGGNLRLFIVGAAELDTSLVDDFTALGIRTLQGYGLTECSPLLAGNSDFYFNALSTGIAIPGVELKIDCPNSEGVGEIIARGENIMLGYFNDTAATEAVIRDGWFHTGDLGVVGNDGELYIKGRIKNVIVSENGKNIFPEELEGRISLNDEVSDVIVVEDKKSGRTVIKAKIFPKLDYIQSKLGHIPSKEETEKIIKSVIETVNEKIPSYKHIKKIEILSEALEKTTTRKIKRFGANVE